MPSALFIGRFQPFHLGHLYAIQEILQKEKFLIIGVGSAQYFEKKENPYTASQRYQMIQSALKEAKINPQKYTIIPVWNIENDALWINHIDRILPPYKNIYTGSEETKKLYLAHYKKYRKHPIKKIRLYRIGNEKISATLIRDKMEKGQKWGHFVPNSVANLLKKFSQKSHVRNK